MAKDLPKIRLSDTDFYIDNSDQVFRQVNNPANEISFNSMEDAAKHYVLYYDPKTKNAFQGSLDEFEKRDDIVPVNVPLRVIDVNGEKQLLEDRMQTVKLKGDEFYFDIKAGYLQEVANPVNKILIADIEDHHSHLLLLYNTKDKTAIKNEMAGLTNTEDMSLIRLPSISEFTQIAKGEISNEGASELPKVTVKEDVFFVDVINQELREAANPSNKISFKDLQDKVTHLQLFYDATTKNAFKGTRAEFLSKENVSVEWLPSLLKLDRDLLFKVLKKPAFDAYAELERRFSQGKRSVRGIEKKKKNGPTR